MPARAALLLGLLVGLLVGGLSGGPAASVLGRASASALLPGHGASSAVPATGRASAGSRSAVTAAAARLAAPPVLPVLRNAGPGLGAPAGPPLLSAAVPPDALPGPVLLVGQLPRPPSTAAAGAEPAGHPGRAPPAPTGP